MRIRIRELLEKNGWTLKKLSSYTDIAVPNLSNYSTGIKKPSNTTIKKIAIAFSVNHIEMLEPPEGFQHVYENGEWMGIIKDKYRTEKHNS